ATFLLANCFAGFLVVVIPGFVGHVLDRLRACHRGLLFLGGSALWLAAALACLVFTYSKGGWLAFGLASVLFVLLLGRKVYQRHAKALMLVLAAGALLAAALFGTGVVPTRIFADVTGSFDVRAGYWRGAADMAQDNLLTGVGLGTYGAHYPQYRHVAARVAQQAHNDYLQVLAELGIVGLVAFLGLWAMYVRNLAARTPTDAAPEPRPRTLPAWLPYLLGFLAIALSNTVDNAFLYSGWGTEPWWHGAKAWYDWGLALALTLQWMLIYKALGGVPMPRPGTLCHKGLLCGAIGFLLHCLVDFDYYEPGVVFTAWVVVALSVKPLKRLGDRALSRRAALSLGVVAILAMIAFQLHLTHTVRGAAERDLARRAVTDAASPAPPEPHARLLGRARRHFEAALSSLPLDDTLCLEYADLLHSQLMLGGYRDPSLFARAASLYTRAATLNRTSPAPRMRLAALFERAADAGATATLQPYIDRLVPGVTLPPRANVAYAPAVNAYRAALERDPLRPGLLLQQAIALEKYGDRDAALTFARRALELHETVLRKHAEHVMRLGREELPRARALLARLGKPQ
ncbi:O-antigen ligase family protein, partial [bacterium]|nr:O-antigen ligase family protein [bacterium]